MIVIGYYLLKVILCSGILYGYYRLALFNKAFHHWNRFYLLCAVAASLVFPLIKISMASETTAPGQVMQILHVVSFGENNVSYNALPASPGISGQQLLAVVYGLVSLSMLILLLHALLRLLLLVRQNRVTYHKGVRFINTTASGTPFSFFHYIFWNKDIDPSSETGERIFRHELAHVREKHSVDRLFINIVLVFCWCNPFFWIIRREMHMIHEFIADSRAVEDHNISNFAAMIIHAVYPRHGFDATSRFFSSSIKRRILMLTKAQKPGTAYLGRILALPLLAFVFFAFTGKAKQQKVVDPEILSAETMKPVYPGYVDQETIDTGTFDIPVKPAVTAQNKGADDTVKPRQRKNEELLRIEEKTREVVNRLGDRGRNGIIIVETLNGEIVYGSADEGMRKFSEERLEGALYVVNGEEMKREDFLRLKPGTIITISLVNKEGWEKYRKGEISLSKDTTVSSEEPPMDPLGKLLVIDGGEVDAGIWKSIDQDCIESLRVLNENMAMEKYGAKGKNGAVIVTTKNKEVRYRDPSRKSDVVFAQMEEEASFPGGDGAWQAYIKSHLDRNRAVLEKEHTTGACMLQFIVDKDGVVSNIRVLTMQDTKLAEVAVEAIAESPRWNPAKQNGRIVKAYRKMPVVFE